MNVTLDGFMSGPNGELDWHFPLWSEEMSRYACDQLRMMDTILVGRITYETMAAYWPSAPGDAFADMMNSYPKIVFSKTLQQAPWKNSRIIHKNVEGEILKLKQQKGQDMIIYGSGNLLSTLTTMGLIDEYRIWIHPVAIGVGHPLFTDIKAKLGLRLVNAKLFDSGVIVLYYQPEKDGKDCQQPVFLFNRVQCEIAKYR
jgi:dihydrofolate reductase